MQSLRHGSPPRWYEILWYVEMVLDARRRGVEMVFDAARFVINTGRSGHDGDPHAREPKHVFEMNLGKRHLALDEDELAPLLHHHIGGAFQEIGAATVRNRRQSPAGAGAHYHCARRVGAARDRRRPLFAAEHFALAGLRAITRGQRLLYLRGTAREFQFGLHAEHHQHQRRQQEIDLLPGAEQALQQPQAVNGARRAGHGESDGIAAQTVFKASASLSCSPPKAPLLMISTWSPGRTTAQMA